MKQGMNAYPIEPWTVTETSFRQEMNLRNETVFTVANGYIGMRGAFEEGWDDQTVQSVNGTYLNGFYDTTPIIYGEEAYGYAKRHQYMLNVTDSKIIELYIDGEKFNLLAGTVHSYSRRLDMRTGCVTRKVEWESTSGKQVEIVIERLASLSDRHLALIRYSVKAMNFSGQIRLVSALNGQVRNTSATGDPRSDSALSGQVLRTTQIQEHGTWAWIQQRTTNTGLDLICGMEHRINRPIAPESKVSEQRVEKSFTVTIGRGEEVVLDKYMVYYTSKDSSEPLDGMMRQKLQEASGQGIDHYMRLQKEELDDFWKQADVIIEGDDSLQQGMRFNAYHLLQSVGRDGKTNIAAKGLTGEGYGGHYFWDTETYILPFFQYTKPDIAKNLLQYRKYILPQARERAAELGHQGILFPWRTISGEEASAYYPAGTAQYHINADIAYAIKKYVESTGDHEFLLQHGLEILVETNRFYADLGCFVEGKGFCLNGVTGPDEYTAIVNNNTYTNVMVKDQLEYTLAMAEQLKAANPMRWERIRVAYRITESELALWRRMADTIYMHREHGLIGQDDSFLQKEVWDFANTPAEKYPLLLHYHPLHIYRHQVLKQADLVLAFYLQRDRFSRTDKARNYAYYEPLTTHDSSLSACVYGIVAAELGDLQKAYDYFLQAVRIDLDDCHGNTKDGIHCASMAGSRLGIVNGFAGMHHDADDMLSFEPRLPKQWQSYRFRVVFRGSRLEVFVTRNHTVYRLLEGPHMELRHYDETFLLADILELPNQALRAVIFDLDGVITDTAEYHYLAWEKLASEIGVTFDRAYNEQLKGIDRMASLELLLKLTDQSFTMQEKQAMAERKNDYYKQFITGITPEDILPGVTELLQTLKQCGVQTALASASKNAGSVIASLGIGRYFDYIVDASTVEIGKPDPEIFIKAAEALGVHPAHCVGIEDSAAGVEAILRAGMKAVGVGSRNQLEMATQVVGSMKEIDPACLKDLL